MSYEPPPGYLGPSNIPRYNGLTDPQEHVLSYEGAMNLYGGGDRLKCRAFSTTLQAPVLRWYATLPKNSINCWPEMKRAFLNRYTASCVQPRSDHTLATVTQKSDESLRAYLNRFHNESSSNPNLSPEVAVLLFTQGLADGGFKDSLVGKPPRDMAELRQRSNKYINLEEFSKGQTSRMENAQATSQNALPRGRPRGNRDDRGGRMDQGDRRRPRVGQQDDRRRPYVTKYDSYTPLTVPRSQVWRETMQTELRHVSRPPFLRNQNNIRDKSKYCNFHDGYGHHTDQCTWLRDVIEDMVRNGKLQQYVREAVERRGRRRSRSPNRDKGKAKVVPSPEKKAEEPQRVNMVVVQDLDKSPENFRVETISGGFAGGGEKRSERKRYFNQVLAVHHKPICKKPSRNIPIIFSDQDMEDIIPDHNDPMVITELIGNFEVARVFIDQGSSADILFLRTFQALKLRSVDLVEFEGNLISFTGEAIRPLGAIHLPVTLGKQPSARTEIIKFLVVDSDSPYNVILGRTCLQAFGAVVSTVHLAMKFVGSDDKVVTIKADQVKARLCYNASLRGIKKKQEEKLTGPTLAKGGVLLAELDVRAEQDDLRPSPQGEWLAVPIDLSDPNKTVKVGADLPQKIKVEIINLLRANRDLFAWTSADMPGIDPNLICHKLSVDPKAKPVAQKMRRVGTEKA